MRYASRVRAGAALVVTVVIGTSLCTLASTGGCGLDTVGAEIEADSEDGSRPRDSRSNDGSSSEPVLDGGADDADAIGPDIDASDSDADAGDTGPCPDACSSCLGRLCRIDCPGPKCTAANITCPPGRPCRIVCNKSGSCSNKQIECAAGEACTLRCEESGACSASTVTAGSASTFCMQCSGNAGCSSVACTTAPLLCGMSCGIGGIGCSSVGCNCTNVLTCL